MQLTSTQIHNGWEIVGQYAQRWGINDSLYRIHEREDGTGYQLNILDSQGAVIGYGSATVGLTASINQSRRQPDWIQRSGG